MMRSWTHSTDADCEFDGCGFHFHLRQRIIFYNTRSKKKEKVRRSVPLTTPCVEFALASNVMNSGGKKTESYNIRYTVYTILVRSNVDFYYNEYCTRSGNISSR